MCVAIFFLVCDFLVINSLFQGQLKTKNHFTYLSLGKEISDCGILLRKDILFFNFVIYILQGSGGSKQHFALYSDDTVITKMLTRLSHEVVVLSYLSCKILSKIDLTFSDPKKAGQNSVVNGIRLQG